VLEAQPASDRVIHITNQSLIRHLSSSLRLSNKAKRLPPIIALPLQSRDTGEIEAKRNPLKPWDKVYPNAWPSRIKGNLWRRWTFVE